jgi:hypothetical protein
MTVRLMRIKVFIGPIEVAFILDITEVNCNSIEFMALAVGQLGPSWDLSARLRTIHF